MKQKVRVDLIKGDTRYLRLNTKDEKLRIRLND
jgi:hypothetical protein